MVVVRWFGRLGLVIVLLNALVLAGAALMGRGIVSQEMVFDAVYEKHHVVYGMDVDRQIIYRLTRPETEAASPVWSPDGTQVAFITDDGINLLNADGQQLRQLLTLHDGYVLTFNTALAWSPDGVTLAFTALDGKINQGIYLLDVNTGAARRVTPTDIAAFAPTWSPDGKRLAFASSLTANQEIFVIDLPTDTTMTTTRRQMRPLTNSMWMDTAPAWSPDGRRIAFASDRDGNSEIYLMNTDGSNLQRLTDHPAIDTAPVWSPDGRVLLFTSGRDGGSQLYRMDADGSNVQRLTGSTRMNGHASWRP